MTPESLVDRLAALPLFESVPRGEVEWLVAHGELRIVQAGTALDETIAPTDEMLILLAGRLALYMQKGGGSRKLLEAVAGQVLGTLPYSRFQRAPGKVIVEETATAFVLHRRHFPVLIRDHQELTTALVHHMLDRARNFRSLQLNDERLQSLSRLASGFAHELNNPASAASRTAQSLVGLIDEEQRAARELAAARLRDDQLAALDAIRSECGRSAQPRTVLEAADREDEIGEWLTRHGMAPTAAEALAASDLTVAGLDRLASALPPKAVGAAIRWIASGCAAWVASRQIEVAIRRVHDLVDAVKGFTFMDREGVPEQVDVARGLADTLAMLEGKARAKAATVHLETAGSLPRVHGVGSEINQVWEKLVDNALDAIGNQGRVTITATARGDSIIVRVADDGPGIPEAIRARVFDPFFTTKPVGQGAGLGLDMARRIVHLHRGDIEFSPTPIVKTPAYEGAPQVSPDGQWLAYVSNDAGQMEVYLRPVAGVDRRWPMSSGGGFHPLWSSNSRTIYYRNGQRLMAVDLTVAPKCGSARRARSLSSGTSSGRTSRSRTTPSAATTGSSCS